MRRTLIAVALAALCSPLLAHTVRFDPPNPTDRTPVKFTISGLWGDGCPPISSTTAISGTNVTVTLHQSQVPCPIVHVRAEEYRFTGSIGALPGGVYRVEFVAPQVPPVVKLAEARLIVRESNPALTVVPDVIFTRPATVRIRGEGIGTCPPNVSPCPPPTLRVTFNNDDSPTVRILSAGEIEAVVPMTDMVAPADLYRVVVTATDGRRWEAAAALARTSPNGFVDPALFERVLVPVIFSGPGAFGSQWTTQAVVENAGPDEVPLFRTQLELWTTCAIPEGCPMETLPAGQVAIVRGQWPTGRYVYAARGNAFRYSVLVKDLSRQAEALGTEIPVVREDDWIDGTVHLLNVPSDSRFRTALRVYLEGDVDTTTAVPLRIYRMGSNTLLVETHLAIDSAHNGQIPATNWIADLTAQLGITPGEPLRIEIGQTLARERIWAFASVTNNDTQHVTVISPQ